MKTISRLGLGNEIHTNFLEILLLMMDSEDFIDFAVIKEKIIKTDQVLHMYSELKAKNQLLEKALKETHKKYKQSMDDLTVLNLEKNHNLHQFEEVKSNSDKFKEENEKLKLELKSSQDDYYHNINEQQNLQLKYQSICQELEECRKSLEEYQSQCTEKMVKKEKKLRRRKTKNGTPSSCKESPRSELSETKHEYDSDGSQISSLRFDQSGEETKSPLHIKKEHKFDFTDRVANDGNSSDIHSISETDNLKSFINSLKEELQRVTEGKANLDNEWSEKIKQKELDWSRTRKELVLEIEELRQKLLKYEGDEQIEINKEECSVNTEINHCINEIETRTFQSLPIINDLDENNATINKPTHYVFDTGTVYTHSESGSVVDDIDDIFREMRMCGVLSPLSEDQTSVTTNITNFDGKVSSEYDEILPPINSNKINCQESKSIPESNEDDKFKAHRELKARKLNSLLTIRKAKQKILLQKSYEILNSTKKQKTQKRKLKPNETVQNMNELFCNEFVNTFVQILNEKLNNSRSRRTKTESRNILEINRRLREKARLQNGNSSAQVPDDTSTYSLSCKSGLYSEEDSCYESLLSNPPSNEMLNATRENISINDSQLRDSIQCELKEQDPGGGIAEHSVDFPQQMNESNLSNSFIDFHRCDNDFQECENINNINDHCDFSAYSGQDQNGFELNRLPGTNLHSQVDKKMVDSVGKHDSFAADISESEAVNEDAIVDRVNKVQESILNKIGISTEPNYQTKLVESEIEPVLENYKCDSKPTVNSITYSELASFQKKSCGNEEILNDTQIFLVKCENFYDKPVTDSQDLKSNGSNMESLSTHHNENNVLKESELLINTLPRQNIVETNSSNTLKSEFDTESMKKESHNIVLQDSMIFKELPTKTDLVSSKLDDCMTDLPEMPIGSKSHDYILSKNVKIDQHEPDIQNYVIYNNLIDQVFIENSTELGKDTKNQYAMVENITVGENENNANISLNSLASMDPEQSSIDLVEIIESLENISEGKNVDFLVKSEHQQGITDLTKSEKDEQQATDDSATIGKRLLGTVCNSILNESSDEIMTNVEVEMTKCHQDKISEVETTVLEDSTALGQNDQRCIIDDEKIIREPPNPTQNCRMAKRLSDENPVNDNVKRIRTISNTSNISVTNSTSILECNSDESFLNMSQNLDHMDLMSGLSDSSNYDQSSSIPQSPANQKEDTNKEDQSQKNTVPVKQKVLKKPKTAVLMRRSIRIYKQRNSAANLLINKDSNISVSRDGNTSIQKVPRGELELEKERQIVKSGDLNRTNQGMKTRNLIKNSAEKTPKNKSNAHNSDEASSFKSGKTSAVLSYNEQLQSNKRERNSSTDSISEAVKKTPMRRGRLKKRDTKNVDVLDEVQEIKDTDCSIGNISKTVSKKARTCRRKSLADTGIGANGVSPRRVGGCLNSITQKSKAQQECSNITENCMNQKTSTPKEKKVNIIQHILLKPANILQRRIIKTTPPQRSGGFKRPNNSKIVPCTPLSPPMPNIKETLLSKEPVIIPLEKPPRLEPRKANELFCKLITFSTEEKTVEEVSRHFSNQEPDHIADLILGHVIRDTEKPDKKNSHAPLMTDTQRVMLGFMLKLEQKNVKDILDAYLRRSELKLFQTESLHEVDTITRLYVAICKSHKKIHRMRRTCCDAFYFMGDLAIPFFFIVLVSWIELLPLAQDSESFPIIKVLIQLVNLKSCNIPGYNLLPLRELLNKYYKYPREPWTTDKFFDELLSKYFRNPVKPADFPILLYCKNNTSKWVFQKINTLLKPTLPKIKGENFKATVIILISDIVSQFNAKTDSEYIEQIKDWFMSLMNEGDTPDVVKKSLILSFSKLPKTLKKACTKTAPGEQNNVNSTL